MNALNSLNLLQTLCNLASVEFIRCRFHENCATLEKGNAGGEEDDAGEEERTDGIQVPKPLVEVD